MITTTSESLYVPIADLSTNHDNIACVFDDSSYRLVQTNQVTPSSEDYNTDALTFNIDHVNDNTSITFNLIKNSQIQSKNSDNSICDLSVLGTVSCSIDYEI